MKYNTARDQLILPEYGRNVQKMVDHATTIQNKEDRNKCVKTIIEFMGQMNPQLRDLKEFNHKLWDDLFIISKFHAIKLLTFLDIFILEKSFSLDILKTSIFSINLVY